MDTDNAYQTTTSDNKSEINTAYELFILLLAIASLVILLLVLFASLPEPIAKIMVLFDAGVCFIFLFDFFRSINNASRPLGYLKWGWLDLVGSISFALLLPPARLPRILRAIHTLRAMEPGDVMRQLVKHRAEMIMLITALIALLVILISSIIVYRVESQVPNANITTGEDALWWALVSMTTVGYGDRFPITDVGRVMATLVIIIGLGLFGVLTSYLASTFLSSRDKERQEEIAAVMTELAEIKQMLQQHQGSQQDESE